MNYTLESSPHAFTLDTVIHIWEMKRWDPGEVKYLPRVPSWLAHTTELLLLMILQNDTLQHALGKRRSGMKTATKTFYEMWGVVRTETLVIF